ncbi:MAG: CcoQ/FixQ family Cbb3-type cytochrome c oxidase assembly chaperone [Gammaproteobacteria bacterium]|nr:CcoQ/FixQ family Cbb3-type cytochrome c oxidase assembly chaperone [Gammaproteobacteria bacterium]
MDMGVLRGLATLFAMLAFIAVLAWAYGRRPRQAFREAEQLPLEEDDGLTEQRR